MPITPDQVKEARRLLGWPQIRLAVRAGTGYLGIRQFEMGHKSLSRATVAAIRRALEDAGVEFPSGGQTSVRMKAKLPTISDEAAIGDDPESKGDPYIGSPQ